ncbi:MAG: hypothetical protein AAF941_04045 [Pseudomonadota bacterium]
MDTKNFMRYPNPSSQLILFVVNTAASWEIGYGKSGAKYAMGWQMDSLDG